MSVVEDKDDTSGNWPAVRDSWVEEELLVTPSGSIEVAPLVERKVRPAGGAPEAAAAKPASDPPAPEGAASADPTPAPKEAKEATMGSAAEVVLPPPASEIPMASKTIPPPLPSGPALPTNDPARSDLMFERLAANDYEGALLVAQSLIARVPHDDDALECAEMSARELWKLHEQRLGSLDRVPEALLPPDGLPPSLNLRAGFLLARVDGVATVREIVDRAGLPLIDALRGMAELYLVGAIGFSTPLT
jgi:hypothetical protein